MSLIIGKALSASELIEKNRNRAQYANYLMQKTAVQYGLQKWIKIEGGSGGTNSESSTYYTDVGSLLVTTAEQDLFIRNITFLVVNTNLQFYMPTSGNDLLSFVRAIVIPNTDTTVTPTSGGTLTINGYSFGSFDYMIANTTTVSTFTSTDWFTTNADNSSALIVVNGNLIIGAGQTFTPPVRKLFTVIYVKGDLTVNGAISMTGLGANSTTVTSNTISLASGTYSIVGGGTVATPAIPGTGGAGAASLAVVGQNSGTSGSGGGSGGGGGGTFYTGASGSVGTGSAGTAFSGGSGSGALIGTGSSENAGANGGAGGAGFSSTASIAPGGAGNPGGSASPAGNPSYNGGNGTGGTLIIICEGTLSGSGTITANGVAGGINASVTGGGSGGGSVTVFTRADSSSITPTANAGGNGGAGTARKLLI